MEYSKYSMSCMWVVLHKITQDPSQFLSAIQECVCIYMYTLYIYIFPVLNSYILCARYTYIYTYSTHVACEYCQFLPAFTSHVPWIPLISPSPDGHTGWNDDLRRLNSSSCARRLRCPTVDGFAAGDRWSWLKDIERYWDVMFKCQIITLQHLGVLNCFNFNQIGDLWTCFNC